MDRNRPLPTIRSKAGLGRRRSPHAHGLVTRLLDAGDRSSTTPRRSVSRIAITDHNVFGGALEAVELARDRELIVIPGEEVKTDGQGESSGCSSKRRSRAGCRSRTRIGGDPRAGGHRLVAPSTGCTPSLTRRPCIGTSRISRLSRSSTRAFCDSFNDEALRFARKYRLLQGAGSDAHVLQGVGTGALRMRRSRGGGVRLAPHGRSAAPSQVALRTCSRSSGSRKSRKGPVTEKGCPTPCQRPCPPTRSTSYLKKAIAEINELGDEPATGDGLRPGRGIGHPLADVLLLKYLPLPEIQEGAAFFGRSGQAVLKSLQRLHVDPLAVYGTNCLKFGTEDPQTRRRG